MREGKEGDTLSVPPFQLNFLIQCCFDGIFLIKGILSERPAQFSLIRIKFHLVPRHIQFRTLCVQYLPCRSLLVRALILFPDPLFRLFLSHFAFFHHRSIPSERDRSCCLFRSSSLTFSVIAFSIAGLSCRSTAAIPNLLFVPKSLKSVNPAQSFSRSPGAKMGKTAFPPPRPRLPFRPFPVLHCDVPWDYESAFFS